MRSLPIDPIMNLSVAEPVAPARTANVPRGDANSSFDDHLQRVSAPASESPTSQPRESNRGSVARKPDSDQSASSHKNSEASENRNSDAPTSDTAPAATNEQKADGKVAEKDVSTQASSEPDEAEGSDMKKPNRRRPTLPRKPCSQPLRKM